MANAPKLTILASSFEDSEVLVSAARYTFPASVVSTNAAQIGFGAFAREWVQDVYAPATVTFDPVRLGRFPNATRMLGGDSYWLLVAGALVAEQLSPLEADIGAGLAALCKLPFPEEEIDEPCVLVARYGHLTWGHWLAEIMPRAILAEMAYPNRFKYVVPYFHPGQDGRRTYGHAVAEAFAAYGIAADRLITAQLDRHYRFKNLYGVSGLWSQARPHPGMLDAMRALPPMRADNPRKVAMLRRDVLTRNIYNFDSVERVLRQNGFELIEMGNLKFVEQVSVFRNADTVFGISGSGMTGLIYARKGIRVIGASPGAWRDAYFYPIMQEREALFADLRGAVVWDGSGLERDAPFMIFQPHLESALHTISQEPDAVSDDGMITIAGVAIPQRLGALKHELSFAAGGGSESHLGIGWGQAEPEHTWTLGPINTLRMPLPDSEVPFVLELDIITFNAPPYVVARRLEVLINGACAAVFDVRRNSSLYVRVPDSHVGAGALEIELRQPFCFSARQLNIAPDDRPIGVGFKAIRVWQPASCRSVA